MVALTNLQKSVIKDLKTKIENYQHTYFATAPRIGKEIIINEIIKQFRRDCAIYYLVNGNQELVNYIVESLNSDYELTKKFNITTVLRPLSEGQICVFSANDSNMDKKLKNINLNCKNVFINNLTLTDKAISTSKITNKLNPYKELTITYPERLTSSEENDILTKKVGYVYAKISHKLDEEFINGYVSLTTDELEQFTNEYTLEQKLLMAGVDKLHYLQCNMDYIDNINLCNLIMVKKKEDISRVKDFLIESCFVKIDEIYYTTASEFPKSNKAENFDSKYKYIIFTKPELVKNITRGVVLTILKDCATSGVYYTLITNSLKTIENRSYAVEELNYKYLYTYDDVKAIKDSLKPSFLRATKEGILNLAREDIEPIVLTSYELKKGSYTILDDNDLTTDVIHNSLSGEFGYLKKRDLIKKGLFNKTEQSIMIDSFIRCYNDYTINQTKIVDDIEQENFDYAVKRIKETLNEQDVLCYKLDATQSAPIVFENIFQYFKKHFKLESNNIYKLIGNDLDNKACSKFKIVLDNMATDYFYANKKKNDGDESHSYRRTERSYELQIPFVQEEIVPSSIIKANKCGMTYATKAKQMNENLFIEYLEQNDNVEWWIKNGDKGEAYFGIPYYMENEPSIFYPDWIIQLKNGNIFIGDTKDGNTLLDNGLTPEKIKVLKKYCDERHYYCGIISQISGVWKINSPHFEYLVDKDKSVFISLNDYFDQIAKE